MCKECGVMCDCSHNCNCARCKDERSIEAGIGGAVILIGGVFLAGWAVYKLGKGVVNLIAGPSKPKVEQNKSPNQLCQTEQINLKPEASDSNAEYTNISKDITGFDLVLEDPEKTKKSDLGFNKHRNNTKIKKKYWFARVTKSFRLKSKLENVEFPVGYVIKLDGKPIFEKEKCQIRILKDKGLIWKSIKLVIKSDFSEKHLIIFSDQETKRFSSFDVLQLFGIGGALFGACVVIVPLFLSLMSLPQARIDLGAQKKMEKRTNPKDFIEFKKEMDEIIMQGLMDKVTSPKDFIEFNKEIDEIIKQGIVGNSN